MLNTYSKIHKKLLYVAVGQGVSAAAIIVPSIVISKGFNSLSTAHKNIASLAEETKELGKTITEHAAVLREGFKKVLDKAHAEFREIKRVSIQNAQAVYTAIEILSNQMQELKEELNKKVEENKQEVKKVWDLANQTLDLMDEQTTFIDKWFDRTEAYHDGIYSEVLDIKENLKKTSEEMKKSHEDIESWLREGWYDAVTSPQAEQLKQLTDEVSKVKHAGAALWEITCIANYNGLLANTSIDLALKDYLVNGCGNYLNKVEAEG